MNGFAAVLGREMRLALRHPADTLSAVMFFVLVAALFPFGVGPSPELLARLAPGALLSSALLAALLPLDRLFGAEAEDGSLDQLLLSGLHPAAIAGAKALGHWLTTGVPLVLAAPLASALLNLPSAAYGAAMLALGLASAVLSALGAAGAALTLGARRGGVLLPLLVLPLAIPAVIFGAAAIEAAASGLAARPYLLLAAALLAVVAPLAPMAAGAALRSE